MAGRNRKKVKALVLALSVTMAEIAAALPPRTVRSMEIESIELIEEPEIRNASDIQELQNSETRASEKGENSYYAEIPGSGELNAEILSVTEISGTFGNEGTLSETEVGEISGSEDIPSEAAGDDQKDEMEFLDTGQEREQGNISGQPVAGLENADNQSGTGSENTDNPPATEPGNTGNQSGTGSENTDNPPATEPGNTGDQPGTGSENTDNPPATEPGNAGEQPGTESEKFLMDVELMTEPETGDGQKESELETETEPESETEPNTDGQNISSTQGKVYLGIDNRHIYEGMEQSFSDGYQPEIKDGILYLVVPFTASGPLKKDCLTVDLSFAEQENTPFVFKNYQKDVKKKQYLLINGKMTENSKTTGANSGSTGSNNNVDSGSAGSNNNIVSGSAGSNNNGSPNSTVSDNTNSSASEKASSSTAAPLPADTGTQCEAFVYTCQIPLQETAAPGQYSLTVKAWGYTLEGEKVTLDYQIFVRIQAEAEDSGQQKGGGSVSGGSYSSGGSGGYSGGSGEAAEEIIRQPKMLLETCNLSGQELEAGSQEQLEVSFRNRSDTQAMYNLKVLVSADISAIRLTRSSFYFSKVDPGEEISLEESLGISGDTAAGAVPLSFTFEYEDKKGNAATGTESVTLSVVQPVRMELEAASLPVALYASDTVELSMTAVNLSRTGVYNVRIGLEGTGLFPVQDLFIGNMEAGTEGSGTMRIYVGTKTMESLGMDQGTTDQEKYGPVTGSITLKYEDANGETHEITKEYQTEIKKAQILTLEVEEEEEANSWWISIFSAVIAGLFLLILFLFLRLRRKNILLEESRRAQ